MWSDQVMSTLQDLLAEDYSSVAESALLDNPWRGAEAYHYYLLAQQQLHSGNPEDALATVRHQWTVVLQDAYNYGPRWLVKKCIIISLTVLVYQYQAPNSPPPSLACRLFVYLSMRTFSQWLTCTVSWLCAVALPGHLLSALKRSSSWRVWWREGQPIRTSPWSCLSSEECEECAWVCI